MSDNMNDNLNTDQNMGNNPTDSNTPDNLEARVLELENNWKRALADYKNLEKRVAEEKEDIFALSNLVVISQLIPILDNMEMLEAHIKDTGLMLVLKEFKQVLKNNGLEEIDAVGKEFDPTTMEAVEMVEGEPNKVISIDNKGYKIKEKLVRPVRVKVGQVKS
ncbi:MAG: hypothetical protein ACD_22C00100G0002 [uncultured bacterium]|nr:MAG: hypothetical protein ACD_22C00100G0002 [uncultured bacterium]